MLRDPSGAYWTGWQYVTKRHFPNEQSSYTGAAMVLAADTLCGATAAGGIFRDVAADPAAVLASGDEACGCDLLPASSDDVAAQ